MTRKISNFETSNCSLEQVLVIVGAQGEVLELRGELGEVSIVVPLQGGVDIVGHSSPILVNITIIGPELSLLPGELPNIEPVVEVCRAVLSIPLVGGVGVPVEIVHILALEIPGKSAPCVIPVVSLIILWDRGSVVGLRVVIVLPLHGIKVDISVVLVPLPLGVVILAQGGEPVVQHVVVVCVGIPPRTSHGLWW